MVYQDYELIPTKRVNRQRHGKSVFLNRVWNKYGGWYTLYFGAASGLAGHAFLKPAPLPTPLFTSAGVRSALRSSAVLAGPTVVGLIAGAAAFGEPTQQNLIAYREDFKQVHQELYYK